MTIPQYGVFTPDALAIVPISGLTNATVGMWYRGDTSAAAFTVNLPTSNVDGGTVLVENAAGTSNITVTRSGSDTIEGSTFITIVPGTYAELTYRVADATWYRRQPTWEPTPGRNMRRDAAGRTQVVAGAASSDVVNKGQLDAVAAQIPAPQPVWTYTGTLSLAAGISPRVYNDTGRTLTIRSVRASVVTAPTGSAVIVDVNRNDTTIFTTQANRPTIAVSGLSSGQVTNMDVTTWSSGQYLTFDIDQIGSTTPGATLSVAVVAS